MSQEVLPTVRVVRKEDKVEVTINESDFTEELYEKVGAAAPEKTSKPAKAPKAPETKPTFTIAAKDDKFIIVDADGVQQGEVFDSEEAAKSMLAILGA